MQKGIRFNETQLQYLAAKSRRENTISGYLHKRSSDTGKWQLRYFVLYQNLLFHFESESAQKLSGATLLEGSYCERVLNPAALKAVKDTEKQYCFTITYKSQKNEITRQIDFRTDTEVECNAWIDHVKRAPYSKVLEQREELEQKHLHLLQILDSERQAKWHYVQQTEELATSVKELRTELQKYKKERVSTNKVEEETDEIKKIKKVQSFFRGWLCRRRWKQIVELYIRSPHAESMRKRNSIVFSMVECEEEYNRQLSTLVTCFLHPLRMAASSKKPPITHEDVNSIFLNSETLLFLHQIFLKGLCARLENWPTLVLGDLFDMLLPMLCIYQEYVRNHHYSLQVLAEYKQRPEFNALLKRYEEKPMCETRTLEIFLTYPMHQIPRYIITLHELLAHTPHDHVERKSLEFAKSKLEELSRIMHDEVSETENIRKNLSIERMIIEGCDILLDVNQTFVRQGPLIQVFNEKSKSSLWPIKDRKEKEVICQVFLFTNHMLLTTRASNGRLHLAKHYGKIPLIDCTLIEDPGAEPFINDPDTSSVDSIDSIRSTSSLNTLIQPGEKETRTDYNGLDFKIIVDTKSGNRTSITLVAATRQEKLAWCSDISQCIEDLHYSDLLNTSMSESSSVTMPQSVRYIHSTQIWSDRRLFSDDVDIKFSRTLNSCKVPQIRHASVERILDRLTDLRFLSIDFLNTFLLTYRVFTDGKTVLEALKRVYKNPESGNLETSLTSCQSQSETNLYGEGSPPQDISGELPKNLSNLVKPLPESRRISTGCMSVYETRLPKLTQESFAESEEESSGDTGESDDAPDTSTLVIPGAQTLAPLAISENLTEHDVKGIILPDSLQGESSADNFDELYKPKTTIPPLTTSSGSTSSYTLKSTASSDTLTPGTSPKPSPRVSPRVMVNDQSCQTNGVRTPSPRPSSKIGFSGESLLESLAQIVSPTSPKKMSSKPIRIPSPSSRSGPTSPTFNPPSPLHGRTSPLLRHTPRSPSLSPKHPRRTPSPISPSMSSPNIMTSHKVKQPFLGTRGSLEAESLITNTRSCSLVSQIEGSPPSAKAGVVVSSHRKSKRRSSSSAAVAAFAAATAGSVNSQDQQQVTTATGGQQTTQQKQTQSSPRFLTSESKFGISTKENFDTLSAMDIAEQLTYLDHKIFMISKSASLLSQAWMKAEKSTKAPHVLLVSKRFNEVSRLVVSEIVRRSVQQERVACIEKWAAIADICRCMNNYNGVLQICAAFVNSSVYRLKKTWEKIPKSTKQTIEKLQDLVSSNGRFKNMRDALHRCDPPCIPYLGMYLTDLSIIEEGIPGNTDEGLVNFSKMRTIAHVIREIRLFQQTPYKIEHIPRVTNYLLDTNRLLDDDQTYRASLEIEPKQSRLSNVSLNPS
ncbi:ras-specific guanine nucleotide-releasing factor 1-like [Saccostrea cucullata]|uniref:ras-specific guanine nucleotide-releasing factor 1-like n=1 Tax=Saccostrea cuccullata TaxID=36930 RepID=UPI002ED06014